MRPERRAQGGLVPPCKALLEANGGPQERERVIVRKPLNLLRGRAPIAGELCLLRQKPACVPAACDDSRVLYPPHRQAGQDERAAVRQRVGGDVAASLGERA